MIFVTRISRDPSILVNFVMNSGPPSIFHVYYFDIGREIVYIKLRFFRFLLMKKEMYYKTFSSKYFLVYYTLFTGDLRYQVFHRKRKK